MKFVSVLKKQFKWATVAIVLNYCFDAFDGNMARSFKMESKFGDYYDHVSAIIQTPDVSKINCSEGDEVIIINSNNQNADQLARKNGTISYEILTSLSNRIKRIYIK